MTTPQFPSYIKKIYSHELVGIYLFLICLLAAGMPSASQSCGKSWDFFSTRMGMMLTSSPNFMSSDCNHHHHHHVHHHHDHDHDHQDVLTSDAGIHLRLPLVHHARRLPLFASFSPPVDVYCRRPGHSVRRHTHTCDDINTDEDTDRDTGTENPEKQHLLPTWGCFL